MRRFRLKTMLNTIRILQRSPSVRMRLLESTYLMILISSPQTRIQIQSLQIQALKSFLILMISQQYTPSRNSSKNQLHQYLQRLLQVGQLEHGNQRRNRPPRIVARSRKREKRRPRQRELIQRSYKSMNCHSAVLNRYVKATDSKRLLIHAHRQFYELLASQPLDLSISRFLRIIR